MLAGRMDLTDDELVAGIADLTLPGKLLDHRAHLRFAWIVLQRCPLPEAIVRVGGSIRAFAANLGATEKYHATLTEALVRIMAARGAGERGRSFEGFLADNPELVRDARGVVLRYYGEALLWSPEARAGWVAPDREPLPM
jgi:hypothetical protein